MGGRRAGRAGSGWRVPLLVVCAVALNAAALAWFARPLAGRFATHLSNRAHYDVLHVAWALAWQAHALATDPVRIADANVYAPATGALFYGAVGFGLLPFFAPILLLTGNPALALNTTYLGNLLLAALGVHLLVWRWSGRWIAGAVAAGALWLSPAFAHRLAAHPQYAALWPFPALLLALERLRTSRLAAVAVPPLVALLVLADLIYVAPAVLLPTGLVAVAWLARRDTRAAGFRLVLGLAAAILLLAPVVAGYAAVRAANPDLLHQTLYRIDFRVPWGTSAPTTPWPSLLGLVAAGAVLRATVGRHARGRATPAIAWGLVATYWAAGMALALWAAPVSGALLGSALWRFGERLGYPCLVALAVGVGLALAEGIRALRAARVPRAVAVVACASLCALAAALDLGPAQPGPIPVVPAPPVPREAALLATLPGPVLELPLKNPPVTAVVQHTQAMYRSIWHWRPLLNGYGSYWPVRFPERMELAVRLPDPAALAALHRETGLATVVVRTRGMPPADVARWRTAATAPARPGLRLVGELGDVLVLRVEP